jgi:hypothetical protein
MNPTSVKTAVWLDVVREEVVGGNGRCLAREARDPHPFHPTPFSRIIEPTKAICFG